MFRVHPEHGWVRRNDRARETEELVRWGVMRNVVMAGDSARGIAPGIPGRSPACPDGCGDHILLTDAIPQWEYFARASVAVSHTQLTLPTITLEVLLDVCAPAHTIT